MKIKNIISSIFISCLVNTVQAGEVMVAVAANFSVPMQKISEIFEKETGHKVLLSFGSTGGFYAQIKNGAPYQVLFSADNETVEKLIVEGYAIDQTQFTYAIGRLALWSAKSNFVDESGEILKENNFKKIAIANPKLAPYGQAAIQTLVSLKLKETLEQKFIVGENITQTFQFVLTQSVDLGFIALSQVYQDGKIAKGSAWMVPAKLHDPILQDAVVLKAGKDSEVAKSLLRFVKTDRIRSLIKSYGYSV